MLKHRKVVRQTQTLLYTSRWRCPKQPQAQCVLTCQTRYIATMVEHLIDSRDKQAKKNSVTIKTRKSRMRYCWSKCFLEIN